MIKNKKIIFGLFVFAILTLILVFVFGKLDEPEVIIDNNTDKSYDAIGIVLQNKDNTLLVRTIDGADNVTLSINDNSINEGDFINFEYNDNYVVEDYLVYNQIDVKVRKIISEDYYESKLISSSKGLKNYPSLNLEYDEEFFNSKNLYIARQSGCPSINTLSIYFKNNNLYFLEDDKTGMICTQEVKYEYYIVEIDKNYRVKNHDIIYSTLNRNSFYSKFYNNEQVDMYLFKKNDNYAVGFLGNSESKLIAPYLRALPLSLEEGKEIYQRIYNNKNIRIINYDNLSEDEVNFIKSNLGVE